MDTQRLLSDGTVAQCVSILGKDGGIADFQRSDVTISDGAQVDAFGNLRTSSAIQLLGVTQEYNFSPLVFDHYTAGTGSATHSVLTNSTVLSTGGASSGARALRQTKLYLRYTPGKSHLIKQTGTLRKGAAPSGAARTGIGYYDDRNGVFFTDTSSGVFITIRSDVSGSVVENSAAQSAWNIDRMDGSGPSGATIDWTKEQIFVIDLQWLGVGRVRCGLSIDGALNYVHEFNHANGTSAVYMRTGCLPVRYESFNDGGPGSNVSVEAICASVDSEGGVNEDAFYSFAYSAYVGAAMSLDTTFRPVVSRRLRDAFNGLTVRGHAHLKGFDLLVGGGDIAWQIRYNAAINIGAGGSITTSNVDATNSISEYDIYAGAANTVSGGVIVASGFATAGSGSTRQTSSFSDPGARPLLGRTYANVRDSYTLIARSISGTANVQVCVSLKEQY